MAQSVYNAVGGKFAPVAPAPHFLRKEAEKMQAEKIGRIPTGKALAAAKAEKAEKLAAAKKAAVHAASGTGMWMLVGSIGVICVCAVYVMLQQHVTINEREQRLTELERDRIKKKHGLEDAELEQLEQARAEAAQIFAETGERVCGVYPTDDGHAWKLSLSDNTDHLISLAGGHHLIDPDYDGTPAITDIPEHEQPLRE